jgi:hypothetical protein
METRMTGHGRANVARCPAMRLRPALIAKDRRVVGMNAYPAPSRTM